MPVRPPLNRLSQPGKNGNPYQICEGDAQGLRPCEPSRRIHQAQVPKNRGKRAGEKQGRNCQSPEYDALGHLDCVRKKRLNCAREPKEHPVQSNRCRAESKAAHHASGRGMKRCKKQLVHCVVPCPIALPVRPGVTAAKQGSQAKGFIGVFGWLGMLWSSGLVGSAESIESDPINSCWRSVPPNRSVRGHG